MTSMFGAALTGGIGSGKSSVGERLVQRGVELVDADQIAHDLQRPTGAAYGPIIERFGDSILAADGTLDRPAIARIVFGDPAALADLNAIVHPLVGERMRERRDALSETDRVVVYDIPLLRPIHRELLGFAVVVVVDCPIEIAVDRLVERRGMDRADALARVAAQTNREDRIKGGDYVVDNSSSLEHLEAEMALLWSWIEEQRSSAGT
jgi:dephospho-CoA kinase